MKTQNALTLYQSANYQTMKNIIIADAASGNHTQVTIHPGTTTRDILHQGGFGTDYSLTRNREGEAIPPDQNLYEVIPDGAKLWVSTPVDFGTDDDDAQGLPWGHNDSDGDSPSSREWIRQHLAANKSRLFDSQSLLTDLLPARSYVRPKPVFKNAESKRYVPQVTVTPLKPEALRSPPQPRPAPRVVRHLNVAPSRLPYWQEKGWSCHRTGLRAIYQGYFQSRRNRVKGRIEQGVLSTDIFLQHPPAVLQRHRTWGCFHMREHDWWEIHHHGCPDVSSGIVQVERTLSEAEEMES